MLFLRHYFAAQPITLFSMVTRLDRSRRTRQISQNSIDLAELDGSCRTQPISQNSIDLAELDGSCRTRRFLQNSTVLAELDRFGSCITLLAATRLAMLPGEPHAMQRWHSIELGPLWLLFSRYGYFCGSN